MLVYQRVSAKFNSKIGLVYVPPISRYLVPGQEMDVRDGMHLSTTYQTIGLYIYNISIHYDLGFLPI